MSEQFVDQPSFFIVRSEIMKGSPYLPNPEVFSPSAAALIESAEERARHTNKGVFGSEHLLYELAAHQELGLGSTTIQRRLSDLMARDQLLDDHKRFHPMACLAEEVIEAMEMAMEDAKENEDSPLITVDNLRRGLGALEKCTAAKLIRSWRIDPSILLK